MISKRLSHYVIEDLLGKGGMGEVYRARDVRLDRSVAVKVLPDTTGEASEALRRFVTEAKAASALNHPNIVTVHDIGREGATHFIVMEKIDGEPLSSLRGAMPLDRFFEAALQITSALAAAHAAGIIHRDIKPANVMVTESGAIKVVDFGLARLGVRDQQLSDDEPTAPWTSPETAAGVILGTVGYMSPEQLHGRRATPCSDVFSLGVLFYEMLAGTAPFRAESRMGTIAAILNATPPPLASLRNDLPPPLIELVDRCLMKDPEARYASATELHEALLRIRPEAGEREKRSLRNTRVLLASMLVLLAVALTVTTFWYRHESKLRWVRNMAVPEIERLFEAEDAMGAWVLAKQAMAIAPNDSHLLQTWVNLTMPVTITSDPPAVDVSISSYNEGGEWVALGRTPLENLNIPFSVIRYRVSAPGYNPIEVAPVFNSPEIFFRLHRPHHVPDGMVSVTGGQVRFQETTATVPDFWIDRFEVTNAEYQRFVDAGGYRIAELWKHPFVRNGRTLSRELAMAELVDQTGLPGPSGWEFGRFPAGQEDHPVEGISWYEASAYAQFVKKSLPTVFHWKRAAANDRMFSDILAVSNFSGRGAAPVGSYRGLGTWGTYDMAGNVMEWCLNAAGDHRYALGGSWYDPAYTFSGEDAHAPLDRREGMGLRLMWQEEPLSDELTAEVQPERLPVGEIVDDSRFEVYARLFDYDPLPLDVRLEESDDSHTLWRKETVSYTAAYGGERITTYLFIPRNARPPYQAVIFFPGSDAALLKSSRHLWLRMAEFYARSGRVLVYPVYQGTYERQVPIPRGPNANRDLRVQRTNDIRRTVDYLVTRDDVDGDRIAFYGLSLGGSLAPYALALDSRFRCAIIMGGRIARAGIPPEIESQHFLARVRLPLLYIGGRHDFMVPVETEQREYFEIAGTPAEKKKHYVFDGGHVPIRFNDAVREMLAWTDQWMGGVTTSGGGVDSSSRPVP